ncbi:tRNA lysidine(34) synthetase TilS [Planktosalinus lacus]|uniref:tRNA(Ile)-lysidine synthase n=1 Tax=Planktosalinus lacus TaxID=1526573 RepID=A0A8J2VCF6_9FLAO|nr:tRNA lysidine(34) synthetase TilS [Planktosalinus lacus]GGD97113.1 tRNA(Ile)-lysidine synthase [Planktosalinus lacus]
MKEQFQTHLIQQFPEFQNQQLLVACSGGLDSVVMTHLLVNSGYSVTLAHCNFSLRGSESDSDSAFVIRFAKKLGVPVYTETFETVSFAEEKGLSIQMAARVLRYNWFDELADMLSLKYILTAHHLDDDLETFFINFSRGTGLKGLTGIPELSGNLRRPLLEFSREAILEYAQANKLKWREDSSNASDYYLRNALRHQVIPHFKEINPQLLQSFKVTQEHLKSSRLLLEDYVGLIFSYVAEKTENGYQFSVEKLKKLPNTKALLFELFQSFGFTQWEDVLQLLDAQTGKRIYSQTHVLLKNRTYLELELMKESNSNPEAEYLIPKGVSKIETPIYLTFQIVKAIEQQESGICYVDEALIHYPLKLRKWKKGDVFHPLGMSGKKKISKFFKDEKLSLLEKQNIWLLCSNETIVWVVGMRADNRFKITENTQSILKIQLQL